MAVTKEKSSVKVMTDQRKTKHENLVNKTSGKLVKIEINHR